MGHEEHLWNFNKLQVGHFSNLVQFTTSAFDFQYPYRFQAMYLTSWSTGLLQNQTRSNVLPFMEPTGSLPHAQEPDTVPYLEADESNPLPPTLFSEEPF
jgi:hypothetical protein